MNVQHEPTEEPSVGDLFARRRTGLVREVSGKDAAAAGASSGPLGQFVVFSIPFGVGLFAAASVGALYWSLLIAAVFSIPVLINYAVLASAMPRSGGDYVFNSRLVTPAFGFTASFVLVCCQIIGVGAFAALAVKTILSPTLTILGAVVGSNTLQTWGADVAEGGWLIGLSIVLLIAVALTLVLGTRKALRINSVIWVVGMVSMAILLVVLVFTSRESFIASYNAFAGQPDAYKDVIAAAADAGFAKRDSLLMVWPLTAVAMAVFGWSFWMSYFGGEIKQARLWKREVAMMLTPQAVNFVLVIAITAMMMKTFGYDFLAAAAYLSFVDPSQLVPAAAAGPPVFFTGIAAGSDIVAAVFMITFLAWAWPLIAMFMIMPVRTMFAWSMDQVFPARLAEVSPRTNTPVKLTLLVLILAIAVTVISAYTDRIFQIFAVQIALAALASHAAVGVAAIAFARRMPELYRAQWISRYRVFGIPLLVLSGIVAIAFTIFWVAAYFRFHEEFGMTLTYGIVLVVVPLAGLVLFHVMRTIRARAGLPMHLAFKEIPPE